VRATRERLVPEGCQGRRTPPGLTAATSVAEDRVTMARVLGAIRQSKTKDRAVSPTTQREKINAYAADNGHHVVKLTEDLSKSGKVSAFKRPKLGLYLTDPDKVVTWDILVATRLDRLCRSTLDYLTVRDWAAKNGKRLVLLSNPDLDESTPSGRALSEMQATFAQLEREMIRERRLETLATLAKQGRWAGGVVPYGWRAEKRTEGYYLLPDDGENAEVLRAMADMAIAGKYNGQIQRWLNAEGHPNAAGNSWSVDRVRLVLHSNETAKLLGDAKARELHAALRSRAPVNRGERVGGHQLLRVAFCRGCDRPLYAQVKAKTRHHAYYKCLNCRMYLRMGDLEDRVSDSVVSIAGDLELARRRLVPGDDHQSRIHHVEQEIETLEKITGTEAVVEAKQTEIARLKSMPYEPDHYVREEMGVKIKDHWEKLDYAERGSFLRTYGVRVLADKQGIEFHGGWLMADDALGQLPVAV
jgi:DNA invertase Pin-like site-specific DNA recombinase